MKLLDGKKLANKIKTKLKREVGLMKIKPVLAIVLVGDDLASELYVKIKERMCEEIGVSVHKYVLNKNTSRADVLKLILRLNKNKKVNGIIVQLPLPKQLDANLIINSIDSKKDVDGLHPENLGKILVGNPDILPPTPSGIIDMLKEYRINLSSKHVVLVGYGKLVGKPLSAMLAIAEKDATITICNAKTKNLSFYTKQADVLVSATGVAGLIKSEMIKKGAIVIDAGTTIVKSKIRNQKSKIVGDVDFDRVKNIAGAITPPVGGIGPMTVIKLIENVVRLADS